MQHKRIAIAAGAVIGSLFLATAAGAANFGLLRSGSDDPVPAVGNLDAGTGGTLAQASTSTSLDDGATTTLGSLSSVPTSVDDSLPDTTTPVTIDDDDGDRGHDDDGRGGTVTTAGSTNPQPSPTNPGTTVTTVDDDDRSGSNPGSDDDADDDRSGSNRGSEDDSSSGHGSDDDD